MSSTYRIFINGNRVSTAVALDNGSYLQVFPHKQEYSNKASWLFAHVMVREEVTIVDPEGVSVIYKPEVYTLFEEGNFVASAGVRVMKEFYLQWCPCDASFMNRDEVVLKNTSALGTSTELCVRSVPTHTVLPPITYPPEEPKRKISAWSKMTNEQRKERLDKMYGARMYIKARKERDQLANPVWSEGGFFIQPSTLIHKESKYWTKDTPGLDPSMRAILSILGPVQRSGEGCDCGEC